MTRLGGFVEDFPGGMALRARNLLGIERVLGPIRAAVLATCAGICLADPPADLPLAAGVFAAGCAYVVFSMRLVRGNRHRIPGHLRSAILVGLDAVFIVAGVLVTGGANSLLLPLLFLGAASAPVRLRIPVALSVAVAYAGAWLALSGPQERTAAAFVALSGAMVALVTSYARRVNTDEVRDSLTNCFGRRPAALFIEPLLALRSFPFSVILLDFDGFKQINDRFGHVAGDQALSALARIVAGRIRSHDLMARMGGDEFLIVAPGTDGPAALDFAERIRSAVHSAPLVLAGTEDRPHLSCSAGIAEAQAGDTFATLLERADRYLYLAKQQGNQVVLAGTEAGTATAPGGAEHCPGVRARLLSRNPGGEPGTTPRRGLRRA